MRRPRGSTKKWSLVALNGIHSVFAMRERGGEGREGGGRGGITDSVCCRDSAIIAVASLARPAVQSRVRRVVRLRSAMLDGRRDGQIGD